MGTKGLSVVGSPRLSRHPDGAAEGVARIEASLAGPGPFGFGAQFQIFGLDGVVLPKRRKGKRTDGLWEHTCLEVFLKPEGGEHYFEFNFAPSTLWAAYALDGYREGMRPLHMGAPSMIASRLDDSFLLRAQFDWRGYENVRRWRVGLSAIIETESGARSFWALAHPPGEPDFHHPDCFALELPRAG